MVKKREKNARPLVGLTKIIAAVDAGKKVYSDSGDYRVKKVKGEYIIDCRNRQIKLYDENDVLNGASFITFQ